MTEQELLQRTRKFAMRVLKLASALPKDGIWRPIASQLVRSGTSVGANYRSACRGRSKAEFLAKLGIVEEEADESMYWMELIIEGNALPPDPVTPLLKETDEIVRIIVASKRTTAQSLPNRKSQIANRK